MTKILLKFVVGFLIFYEMVKMSYDKYVADNYIYEQQRQRMLKHINGELEKTKNYIGIYVLSHAIEQAF